MVGRRPSTPSKRRPAAKSADGRVPPPAPAGAGPGERPALDARRQAGRRPALARQQAPSPLDHVQCTPPEAGSPVLHQALAVRQAQLSGDLRHAGRAVVGRQAGRQGGRTRQLGGGAHGSARQQQHGSRSSSRGRGGSDGGAGGGRRRRRAGRAWMAAGREPSGTGQTRSTSQPRSRMRCARRVPRPSCGGAGRRGDGGSRVRPRAPRRTQASSAAGPARRRSPLPRPHTHSPAPHPHSAPAPGICTRGCLSSTQPRPPTSVESGLSALNPQQMPQQSPSLGHPAPHPAPTWKL